MFVGGLVGAAVASGVFLAVDDDGEAPGRAGEPVAEPDDGGNSGEDVIDPTATEFGELTDAADEVGVRVQWTAELLTGAGESAEFVSAHRGDTVVVIHGDTRIVSEGEDVHVCDGDGCRAADHASARGVLSAAARPYYEVIRVVATTTASPEYRVTGETELEGGIFEQCGTFDPAAFGLAVPEGVVGINQCIDAGRNVPLRIGLQGEDRSLGSAVFGALADARPEDFVVS